ncbi:TIGR03088 family PEP-CTERM/XrtA system glycosyltransferase [Sulfuricystis multivorans]|uniref:TIGR03088 family PEP-CTERM/XrtA system glycosyltransferase n=1 Tax=Sulfuricystis multivorans TaxID=2211108 RepID=UPI000F82AE34|nr:TIGR03088 family PEP-CTERM/XrtA system glycosyltransferase [Sulfuricystis multivorans]
MTGKPDERPLVLHVFYRFDVGGLENGVVNLINRMPEDAYRHAILALTEVTDFKRRVQRDDVRYISLHKPPGHLFRLFPRLVRIFRELRPAIVHSRNLAALEVTVPAWLAGVPVRLHGEHGYDVHDLDGSNATYRWLRRAYNPFVSHWIALSRDLQNYLVDRVGIPARKVTQIYNGVDAERFHPASLSDATFVDCPFRRPEHWLIGTVGRMQAVKNQTLLARAFIRALEIAPELRPRLRLVMVGDGPLRREAQALLAAAGVADLAWLPGERDDVPALLRSLDCFVLPSQAEGISNTILEAMATGLPVIATRVGGNPELVVDGRSGRLVPADDVEAMAEAILVYAQQPALAQEHGRQSRAEVERRFSLEAMVAAYRALYDRCLAIDARQNWSDNLTS